MVSNCLTGRNLECDKGRDGRGADKHVGVQWGTISLSPALSLSFSVFLLSLFSLSLSLFFSFFLSLSLSLSLSCSLPLSPSLSLSFYHGGGETAFLPDMKLNGA